MAHYSHDLSKRAGSPAACNKIEYIVGAIREIGLDVEIISASNNVFKKAQRGVHKHLENGAELVYMPSLRRGKRILNVFSTLLLYLELFFYLLFKIKKNDFVIVYHSTSLMKIVFLLKKLKRFKLILEVEEIYGDVIGSKKIRKKELEFFDLADSYIFPTSLLDDTVNKSHKPSVTIHGVYKSSLLYKSIFSDEKIHIVYAGTLDPRKGGAIAVTVGEFLDTKYHIHVIGFGNEKEKEYLLDEIKKVSDKSGCMVSYDGCLSGAEYLRFIQSCDIGLSTQNPESAFNDTSFPSKILSYMSNGLRVVSVRIPAIESSAIGDDMYYYDIQSPEEIARVIKNVDVVAEYNGKQIIEKLDKKFKRDIMELFKYEKTYN